MTAEKVTVMVLKADLQCSTCYKKIKKLLCKSPQVRDQIFDEKQNQVTITVVCCSPEKIRDKLCYKGGKAIKSIDIKDPPKPKPKESEKPKTDDKPKADKPKDPEKAKPVAEKPKAPEKAKEEPPKATKKPDGKPDKLAAEKIEDKKPLIVDPPAYSVPGIMAPEPFVHYGYPMVNAGWGYGEPSYEGYRGGPGPYYNGYGRPVPPQPCYNGYSYGYGYDYSDETPSNCTIV